MSRPAGRWTAGSGPEAGEGCGPGDGMGGALSLSLCHCCGSLPKHLSALAAAPGRRCTHTLTLAYACTHTIPAHATRFLQSHSSARANARVRARTRTHASLNTAAAMPAAPSLQSHTDDDDTLGSLKTSQPAPHRPATPMPPRNCPAVTITASLHRRRSAPATPQPPPPPPPPPPSPAPLPSPRRVLS
jgi:hypothetical protein